MQNVERAPLTLITPDPELTEMLDKIMAEEGVSNRELQTLTSLADEFMGRVWAEEAQADIKLFRDGVDAVSQALQRFAVLLRRHESFRNERRYLIPGVQMQLAQIIINYNRGLGAVPFESRFKEYLKVIEGTDQA